MDGLLFIRSDWILEQLPYQIPDWTRTILYIIYIYIYILPLVRCAPRTYIHNSNNRPLGLRKPCANHVQTMRRWRKRERERQGDRETKRARDRETQKQRDREIERQRDRTSDTSRQSNDLSWLRGPWTNKRFEPKMILDGREPRISNSDMVSFMRCTPGTYILAPIALSACSNYAQTPRGKRSTRDRETERQRDGQTGRAERAERE